MAARLKTFFTGRNPDEASLARIEAIKAELREDNVVKREVDRTWRGQLWDTLDKSPTERRFMLKLDASIVTLASLGYFLKILDENNIQNAFVSGMKEDMGMFGDELSNAKALYTAGYVIGQIPSNLLLTRINPGRWLPFCELAWTLCTLGMMGVKSVNSIYLLRFFIGLFESSFYPGIQFIVGSTYRSDEIAKRAIILHTSGAIGNLFSGILQAAVYTNLDGVHGLAGWRWMFLVNFIIGVPIALSGFIFLPNLPDKMTKSWIWTERDIALAQLRMEVQGRKPSEPWTKTKAKRILGGWKIWVLPPLYMLWNNAASGLGTVMPFWLKGWNKPGQPIVYTVPQINHYPLPTTGVAVICALSMAWISDGVLRGRRWPMQVVSSTWALSSAIVLIAIPVFAHTKLHFYLFYSFGCLTGQSGLILTWINELCSADQEERAITVAAANDFAYLMQIWENLSVWRTRHYPAARPGIIFSICLLGSQLLWIGLILGFKHKDRLLGRRRSALAIESDVSSSAGSSDVDEKESKDDVEAVARTEELQKTARVGYA